MSVNCVFHGTPKLVTSRSTHGFILMSVSMNSMILTYTNLHGFIIYPIFLNFYLNLEKH